nr:MAG TPA: hypothetical protein [Caudoviricetes sp.]DAV59909.1 MAG TPA: hypothetical protein [Caudoviricetes sp.]DAW92096.1 MAG TPA: hypothetical protein [Bacteriophage sp.]
MEISSRAYLIFKSLFRHFQSKCRVWRRYQPVVLYG